jgi:hypothetical protein
LSVIGVCIIVNVLEFVPTAVVFMNHWYDRGAVPVALTVNVAVWPVVTVRLVGWEEIAGAVGGVFPPLELEPQPQTHPATARRSTDNFSLALDFKTPPRKDSDWRQRELPGKVLCSSLQSYRARCSFAPAL